MKKNGFTLAELLGVVIILAAISLIAFPPIINQIKNTRSDLDDALNKLIYTAADQYLEENDYNLSGTYCIRLSVLVDDGKLVEPIVDSKGHNVSLGYTFKIEYPARNSDGSIAVGSPTYSLEENTNKCGSDAIIISTPGT